MVIERMIWPVTKSGIDMVQTVLTRDTQKLFNDARQTWSSYQIRKIAGYACARNTRNVFFAIAD